MPGTIICKPMEMHLNPQDEDAKNLHLYCKLKQGRNSVKSSLSDQQGMSVEWSETLKLRTKSKEKNTSLIVTKNKRGVDSKLGKAEIDIEKLETTKKMIQWLRISRRGKVAGEILVDLEYVPDDS